MGGNKKINFYGYSVIGNLVVIARQLVELPPSLQCPLYNIRIRVRLRGL